MTVFEYKDYKAYVNSWVQAQPRQGYGIYSKIAKHLNTNSVVISQTFKGSRDLSLDHAAKLANFMSLRASESDFFLLLVQMAKATSQELKSHLERQLKEAQARGQAIKNRITHQQLAEEDKAIFYSSWYFVATWLAAPLPQFSSAAKLAQHLQVPEAVISEVLRFLLEKGLLAKKGHRFEYGKHMIHVPHDSPHVAKHHMNWRMRAVQSMDKYDSENLHYTAPLSLSEELAHKVREHIIQFIEAQTKQIKESPSEKLMCLNIDWFQF